MGCMAVCTDTCFGSRTASYRKEGTPDAESSASTGQMLGRGQERSLLRLVCAVVFAFSVAGLLGYGIYGLWQNISSRNTQRELQEMREGADSSPRYELQYDEKGFPVAGIAAAFADLYNSKEAKNEREMEEAEEKAGNAPELLPKYKELYGINSDLIGWLSIEGTVIDYPVMQTPEDEDCYLSLDFYGKPNKNGCLILDTDSTAGTGTSACAYTDGTAPSTNLIIHGHTMKSGEMFGSLQRYADAEYGAEHHVICFDSLYEEREYELIAVFYSQVYYENDNVFKYYKFFQADTQEKFDDWYENIKALSLYDTGVTAQLGDEFITLSCCSYQTEDGRFVVVGKRVK